MSSKLRFVQIIKSVFKFRLSLLKILGLLWVPSKINSLKLKKSKSKKLRFYLTQTEDQVGVHFKYFRRVRAISGKKVQVGNLLWTARDYKVDITVPIKFRMKENNN